MYYYDPDYSDSRLTKRPRYSQRTGQRYDNAQPMLDDNKSKSLLTNQELFKDAIHPGNPFVSQDETQRFVRKVQRYSRSTSPVSGTVQHSRHSYKRGNTSFARSSQKQTNFADEGKLYPSFTTGDYNQGFSRAERNKDDPKNEGHKHKFSSIEKNECPLLRKNAYRMDNDKDPQPELHNQSFFMLEDTENNGHRHREGKSRLSSSIENNGHRHGKREHRLSSSIENNGHRHGERKRRLSSSIENNGHRHRKHNRLLSSVDRGEYHCSGRNSVHKIGEGENLVLFPKTAIKKDSHRPIARPSFVSRHNQTAEKKSKANKKERMIGKKYLEKLITKEPNEILLTLCSPENDFSQLLEQIGDRKDLTAVILIALGNACSSDLQQNLIYLVNAVVKKSMFMLCSVQQYLASFHNNNINDLNLQSFEKLVKFLSCYNRLLPASACETLSVILPLLKTACHAMKPTHPELFECYTKEITKLEFQKDHFLEKNTDAKLSSTSKMEKVQMVQPPENFRTIPILPNDYDIWNDQPFLRPNIIDGKYVDIEHYLDVQFRLLREDYIRPLRNGIARYLMLKKDKKSVKKCKDIKIYLDVHIIEQELVKNIPVHVASFNIAEFGKVNWEFSKRFLSGSLVCLSHDDFQTTYFASVVYRDVEKLKNGILVLKFELSDDMLNFNPNQTFVMIETDAYFEAYRHNLSVLQELELDKFPFCNYIVDVSKDIGNPAYLNKSTIYDMRPLFKPIEEFRSKLNTVGKKAVPIQVLNESQWPTAKDLHLDESQHNALKAAITKEFTVIQGPPGTGKTYIGLRIVQLLLHNISHWSRSMPETEGIPPQEGLFENQLPDRFVAPFPKEHLLFVDTGKIANMPLAKPPKKSCPILIVCYTNHALDQFLEGVLLITNSIVRVGGRCSSDKLLQYQLDVLRKTMQQRREVPHHIFSNLRHKNFELKELGDKLSKLQNELKMCTKKLLNTAKLKNCMNSFHYSLLHGKHSKISNKRLCYWLTRQNPGVLIDEEKTYDESRILESPNMTDRKVTCDHRGHLIISSNNHDDQSWTNANEENYMADVQYVEDMRGITNEEFADIDDWKFVNSKDHDANENNKQQQYKQSKFEKHIAKQIEDSVPMSEDAVDMITDVWMLNSGDRWCLYKYWLNLYVKEKQDGLLILQQSIRTGYQETIEMKMAESLSIMKHAKVVGMTTTGAAKYRKMVQHLNPKIVIIEEAAEILESHVVTALAPDTQHLILIGDHQQLRPSVNSYALAVKFNLDVSLFERMVKNGINFQQLTIQHRMHPSIASLLVSHIYQNLENHQSVYEYESIKGVSKNLFFVTHNSEENKEYDSKSKVNEHEAKFLTGLCRYFVLQGYSSSQITVLTTYSGQLFLLKRLIKNNPLLKQVRITVVDNFQGEENDIILLSFVRSNEEGKIGFLSIMNRVCVALSRAKKGLFAIGNFTLLAEKNELWKNIISSLKQQKAIGTALSLRCQNHPDSITWVSNDCDFDNIPEGGCGKPCEYRLNCGHTCTRMCHTYDLRHENITCETRCDKKCENNHRCHKLCYEDCGLCLIRIEKEIPQCKHKVFLPCYKPPTSNCCTARCERKLPCGHTCKKLCGETCSTCYELITVRMACGHDRELRCGNVENKDDFLRHCKSECGMELQCGHICSGTCGRCYQGRFHQVCRKQCKRILVCGHECEAKCSKNCPPCEKICENKCKHNKCPKKCGFSCSICKEGCSWSCKHQKCNRKCGELCDRKPCNIPCAKKLKCGHKCIGLCGDPCPQLCAACNPEVKDIFFGNEDSDDARFVELQDCKHVFEVEGITHWMEMANEREGEIQMKACPKCKTVIRKSLRFGNTVKICLANIEKVKSVIFGNVRANKEKLSALVERLSKLLESRENFDHFLLPLFTTLKDTRFMDNVNLISSENIIIIIEDYVEVLREMYYLKHERRLYGTDATFRQAELFASQTFGFIESFLSTEYSTASHQQLQELSGEIHRVKQIQKFLHFIANRFNNLQEDQKILCKQIADCLCKLGPFHSSDEKQFRDAFLKVSGSALNISDTDKTSILKAMRLTKGHWYKCPNGHVYCITECGGATMESKCNECGATIGGGSHSLRSDNRVATEMDGAQHPAWSEVYNDMRNFDPFN